MTVGSQKFTNSKWVIWCERIYSWKGGAGVGKQTFLRYCQIQKSDSLEQKPFIRILCQGFSPRMQALTGLTTEFDLFICIHYFDANVWVLGFWGLPQARCFLVKGKTYHEFQNNHLNVNSICEFLWNMPRQHNRGCISTRNCTRASLLQTYKTIVKQVWTFLQQYPIHVSDERFWNGGHCVDVAEGWRTAYLRWAMVTNYFDCFEIVNQQQGMVNKSNIQRTAMNWRCLHVQHLLFCQAQELKIVFVSLGFYTHTYVRTYVHTYVRTYKRTNVQTYKHTNIQT